MRAQEPCRCPKHAWLSGRGACACSVGSFGSAHQSPSSWSSHSDHSASCPDGMGTAAITLSSSLLVPRAAAVTIHCSCACRGGCLLSVGGANWLLLSSLYFATFAISRHHPSLLVCTAAKVGPIEPRVCFTHTGVHEVTQHCFLSSSLAVPRAVLTWALVLDGSTVILMWTKLKFVKSPSPSWTLSTLKEMEIESEGENHSLTH